MKKDIRFLIRTNLSCVLHLPKIIGQLLSGNEDETIYGGNLKTLQWYHPEGGITTQELWGTVFAPGGCTILSHNLVEHIVKNKDRLNENIIEDVAIGKLLYDDREILKPEYMYIQSLDMTYPMQPASTCQGIFRNKYDVNNRWYDLVNMSIQYEYLLCLEEKDRNKSLLYISYLDEEEEKREKGIVCSSDYRKYLIAGARLSQVIYTLLFHKDNKVVYLPPLEEINAEKEKRENIGKIFGDRLCFHLTGRITAFDHIYIEDFNVNEEYLLKHLTMGYPYSRIDYNPPDEVKKQILLDSELKDLQLKWSSRKSIAFFTCFFGDHTSEEEKIKLSYKVPYVPSTRFDCYYYTNNRTLYEDLCKNSRGYIPVYLAGTITLGVGRVFNFDCTSDSVQSSECAKIVKILPHLLRELADYDYTVYFDSKLYCNEIPVLKFIDSIPQEKEWAIMAREHPYLSPSVINEFSESQHQSRYQKQKDRLWNYIVEELQAGMKQECEIHYATGYLIRNNRCSMTEQINNCWYSHFLRAGIECQVSFFFVQQQYAPFILKISKNEIIAE